MTAPLFSLQYLIAVLALEINCQQQGAIDYSKKENRPLKAKLSNRNLQFSDAERIRPATRIKAVGRKWLLQLETLVTPDTLLRWHRQLIAQKWNYLHRHRPGRPCIREQIAALVLRMTAEDPSWGYTLIQGALRNLGDKISRGTIANILERNGIDSSPLRVRRTPRSTFLKARWKTLVASDIFTVEVWRIHELMTYYVLFFIELGTRSVKVVSVTTNPDGVWMVQIARNALDCEDGHLVQGNKLMVDRDTKCRTDFRQLLNDSGIHIIRLPPRSPNLSAYAERFVGSIKGECLNQLILVGEASLRRALREYMAHYHRERNHQGLDNTLIAANDADFVSEGDVRRRSRHGGMLNFYYREAA